MKLINMFEKIDNKNGKNKEIRKFLKRMENRKHKGNTKELIFILIIL